VSGDLNSPVNEQLARVMGGVRNFLTSALLGAASITALTDVGFQAVTRAFNGLPIGRAATGSISGYLKLLNPAAREDRQLAVRLGLIAEEASKRMSALNRYVEVSQGPEIMQRLLQRALNVLNRQAADYPDIVVDGVIGPMTLFTLDRYIGRRGTDEGLDVLWAVRALRSARYVEIAERNPSQEAFEYGWLARQVRAA